MCNNVILRIFGVIRYKYENIKNIVEKYFSIIYKYSLGKLAIITELCNLFSIPNYIIVLFILIPK